MMGFKFQVFSFQQLNTLIEQTNKHMKKTMRFILLGFLLAGPMAFGRPVINTNYANLIPPTALMPPAPVSSAPRLMRSAATLSLSQSASPMSPMNFDYTLQDPSPNRCPWF